MDGVSGYLLSFFEFPLRRVLGGGETKPTFHPPCQWVKLG